MMIIPRFAILTATTFLEKEDVICGQLTAHYERHISLIHKPEVLKDCFVTPKIRKKPHNDTILRYFLHVSTA